ncbi:hypothetical protein ACFWY5_12225 [Nonomuraea sp. NPDC059007]|uniref:hypothetical protein n=1 Tax=Nonomuraea sp. NPDC059007 TaxID=3346692 RepID=UPI0036A34C75
MSDDRQTQLETIVSAIATLRFDSDRFEAGDESLAEHAVAMKLSGFGITSLPLTMEQMRAIGHALETGYLMALADVRAGSIQGLGVTEG